MEENKMKFNPPKAKQLRTEAAQRTTDEGMNYYVIVYYVIPVIRTLSPVFAMQNLYIRIFEASW